MGKETLLGADGVVLLQDRPAKGEWSAVDPETVTAGTDVRERTEVVFESPDGRFSTGIWEATSGAWNLVTTEDEYIRLLQGQIRLTDRDGAARLFRPGDSVFIPKGFAGTWECIGDVRKFFAIYR